MGIRRKSESKGAVTGGPSRSERSPRRVWLGRREQEEGEDLRRWPWAVPGSSGQKVREERAPGGRDLSVRGGVVSRRPGYILQTVQ